VAEQRDGVRYRHVEQAVFVRPAGAVGCVMLGLRRPRLLRMDLERHPVFGDAVDGMQQLAHRGDEGEFGWLSCGAETLIEGAQRGIATDRAEHGHPERHPQSGVPERSDRGPCAGSFAGLLEAGDDADIGGEGCGGAEVRGVVDGGEDACGRLRADPVDGGEQLADLVEAAVWKRRAVNGLSRAS